MVQWNFPFSNNGTKMLCVHKQNVMPESIRVSPIFPMFIICLYRRRRSCSMAKNQFCVETCLSNIYTKHGRSIFMIAGDMRIKCRCVATLFICMRICMNIKIFQDWIVEQMWKLATEYFLMRKLLNNRPLPSNVQPRSASVCLWTFGFLARDKVLIGLVVQEQYRDLLQGSRVTTKKTAR